MYAELDQIFKNFPLKYTSTYLATFFSIIVIIKFKSEIYGWFCLISVLNRIFEIFVKNNIFAKQILENYIFVK